MPQSQEKTRESNHKLPNPELNPLLNPTLGKNLGRWAQAYFTSPPEKREEAVLELLRELEAEHGTENSGSAEPAIQMETSNTGRGAQLDPSLSCAECGHQNAPRQRFCGMCGSRLVFSDDADTPPSVRDEITDVAVPARPSVLSQPAEPLRMPTFSGLSLFATAAPSTSESSSDTDIQWLREKSYEAADESRSSSTKFIVTALGLLLLGILLYAQWKPQRSRPGVSNSTGSPAHASPSPQPPEAPSGSQVASQPTPAPTRDAAGSDAPRDSKPERESPTATAEPPADTTGSSPVKPAAPAKRMEIAPVRSASTVQTEAESASGGTPTAQTETAGSAELAAAEGFLSGKYGTRDSSQAAKLLWKAVGKENTTAILLLSNLYLAGDGVPKSCDQARMLLRAAARKNVTEAASKLRQLQQSGCP